MECWIAKKGTLFGPLFGNLAKTRIRAPHEVRRRQNLVQARFPKLGCGKAEKSALSAGMEIRLLRESDSVEAINALLQASYRALADAGMNFSAATETTEETRENIADGECYLGLLEDRTVATVVLRVATGLEKPRTFDVHWYNCAGVANFGRLAISPEYQRQGLASQLMDHIETRARHLGFTELALDTSENAKHLIELYARRGYRQVDHHQWPGKTYRSVIMSKQLAG